MASGLLGPKLFVYRELRSIGGNLSHSSCKNFCGDDTEQMLSGYLFIYLFLRNDNWRLDLKVLILMANLIYFDNFS